MIYRGFCWTFSLYIIMDDLNEFCNQEARIVKCLCQKKKKKDCEM